MAITRYEGLDTLRVGCSFGIVFLHVYVMAGDYSSLNLLLRFRDFALPVMVLVSFFLLTVSLIKKSRTDFSDFLLGRVKRLWLPLVVWSAIYTVIMAFILPKIFGIDIFGESLSPRVFLSGYRHLWYLQFLFIGSLAGYPFIYWVAKNKKFSRLKVSIACFVLSFLYGLFFYFFLKNNLSYEDDINLDIFISQSGNYLLYIPAGIGLGLISDKINYLFTQNIFRRISLGIVLVMMIIHLGTIDIPFTRELYGIAVFLAALQPWGQNPSRLWQMLAAYSYGIYILHFFLVQMLWMLLIQQNIGLNGTTVLILSAAVYFLSFAGAIVIRKLFPFDFLLPLISANPAPLTKTEKINESFSFRRDETKFKAADHKLLTEIK